MKSKLEIRIQGIRTKMSATDDLYKIILAFKSTQTYHIDQLALMVTVSSKTEMTLSSHMFPDSVD